MSETELRIKPWDSDLKVIMSALAEYVPPVLLGRAAAAVRTALNRDIRIVTGRAMSGASADAAKCRAKENIPLKWVIFDGYTAEVAVLMPHERRRRAMGELAVVEQAKDVFETVREGPDPGEAL